MSNEWPPLPQRKKLQVQEMKSSYKDAVMWLFRYEGVYTAYQEGGDNRQIYLRLFPVVRDTPKCYVIDEYDKERFVLKNARKRYAYPTKALAWESFKQRTSWRLRYAQAALDAAQEVEAMIKEIEDDR